MAKVKSDRLPALWKSRKTGRLDGRDGLPELSVASPHSPFLAELKHIGGQHITQISRDLTDSLSSLDDNLASNWGSQAALDRKIAESNSDIASLDDELKKLKDDYQGTDTDSVSSRISDRRYLGGIWYFLIVLVTIVGEVVITFPAFIELFDDDPLVAVLATLAASAMTISYSHILGLSLKRNDDKKRRQPRWVMPTLLSSSIAILGLIFTLSNIRASKFAEVSGAIPEINPLTDDLGDLSDSSEQGTQSDTNSLEGSALGDDSLGQQDLGLDISSVPGSNSIYEAPLTYLEVFLLFSSLQLALVAVATFASYHHFSNSLSEVKRLTAVLKQLRKELGQSIAQKVKLEKDFENSKNKRSEIFELHKAQVHNIERKVLARGQAFWGANMRQRSDSPLAKSREFTIPELELPEWMTSGLESTGSN